MNPTHTRLVLVEDLLILSAKDEEVDKLLRLGISGDDNITKLFSLKEVVIRIKAQLRRKYYLGNEQKNDDKKTRTVLVKYL